MNPDAAQRQTGKVRVHVYLWSKTRPANSKRIRVRGKSLVGRQSGRQTDRADGRITKVDAQ